MAATATNLSRGVRCPLASPFKTIPCLACLAPAISSSRKAGGSRSLFTLFPAHPFASHAMAYLHPQALRARPLHRWRITGAWGNGRSTGAFNNLTTPSLLPSRQQSSKSAEVANQEISLLNSHVASCYKNGLYGDALPHARRAKQLCLERFGRAHPSYASACNNEALLHRSLQDVETAQALYEEALYAYSRSVGTEHPSYATAAVNLAMCLRDTPEEHGNWPRALELLQEALYVRKNKLGKVDGSLGQVSHS